MGYQPCIPQMVLGVVTRNMQRLVELGGSKITSRNHIVHTTIPPFYATYVLMFRYLLYSVVLIAPLAKNSHSPMC